MNPKFEDFLKLPIAEKKLRLERAELISQKTRAVYDGAFTAALKSVPWAEWLEKPNPFRCREEYLTKIKTWILNSKLNRLKNLDQFPVLNLVNGTTQVFDEAYFKFAQRRLRIFRGEYAYHRRSFPNHKFIEDEDLSANDFLIISLPFCSTGEMHSRMPELLDRALQLKVPVIVDCAYFGTCHSLNFDFAHEAIEQVTFSLTKGIGLGDIRSGIRFTRAKEQGPIQQQNDYDHTILAAAKIGIFMMEQFSPDYIPEKYLSAQREACELLGLKPTPCMHLALGDETWKDYRVDSAFNRVGIRDLIKRVYRKELHEYV